MLVDVTFLTDFNHGRLVAVRGKSQPMEKYQAEELERNGLLRVKTTPVVKAAGPAESIDAGKAQDDGAGQPSSASPVAPASPTKTLTSSGLGSGRIRKPGA